MIWPRKIYGERIFLATLDPCNLSLAYQLWMKDPEILKFLANPEGNYAAEALKAFVADTNASPQDQIFGIFLKNDERHIGNIKIGNIHSKHKFSDLGVIIGEKTLWGKGFATEAIGLAVQHAFTSLKLHRVFAGIFEGNDGSRKAFLKAGFIEVECCEEHFLMGEKSRNCFFVEKINE
ncbi:MAG: GNAT family N-acetyltransferase [Candidatus Omnitrophota bacterium]